LKRTRLLTLQGHDVATLTLDHLGDHVVDQTVLVPDAVLLKVGLVLSLVDLLENVLESSVILLEDGVLCAHVQRELLVDGELETGVCETSNALGSVVLGLSDTTLVVLLEVEDLNLLGLTTLGGEDHLEGALTLDDEVLCAVLITESVTADDDGLLPAGHETGNARNDDGLTEDGSAESVSDGTVGRQPHCILSDCATFPSSYSYSLFFRLNSLTRASSGVMVAHLTPTEYFLMASAASMVTWSLVSSL